MSSSAAVRLGLRANARQFALLVALNAFVGAMVGLERSVLPVVGARDFGIASKSAILSFLVAFGVTKAIANLAAGRLADRIGRKRLLVAGWLLALPVPVLVGLAPSWAWIVVANVFLGANQGLAWSMTVVMKIDLVGPRRRWRPVRLRAPSCRARCSGRRRRSSPAPGRSSRSRSCATRRPTSSESSGSTAAGWLPPSRNCAPRSRLASSTT